MGWIPAAVRCGAVFVVVLACLAGCADESPPSPTAIEGSIDLRGWDFRRDGIAALDGQWQLEWGRFADPKAVPLDAQAIEVPGAWNEAAQGTANPSPFGFGTYRLKIQCQPGSPLALSLPVEHSAVRWFVNGALIARQGDPGSSAERARAAQNQQIVPIDAAVCPLNLVAHMSNFDVRRGGLMRSVELGDREQLLARRESAVMRDTATIGGLFVMGVLPLLFFFISRRQDRSPLYFGLFCLSFACGMGVSGTRLFQPALASLGWGGYLQVGFITWYALITLFALFLHALYPNGIGSRAVRWIVAWALLSCGFVLLTPASVFSFLSPTALVGGGLVAAYLVWRLALLWRQGRSSAALLLGGLLVFSGSIIHDTLQFQHVTRNTWVPYGVVLFVIAPALLLARRLSRALAAEERLAIEQRERADLLVRSTKAGVLDWDAISNRSTYSDRYREMLGFPVGPNAADPPPFRELLHPDDHDRVHGSFIRQLRDRSLKSGVRMNEPMDYRLRRADGEYLWIHAEAISVCDHGGRTLRFICSFIDISQAKRHEIEMADRVKFINDLFDSLPIALSMRDTQGRYVFANRTWEKYYGLDRTKVIGGSARDQLSSEEAAAVEALDREVLERGPDNPLYSPDVPFRGRDYTQTRTVMADARNEPVGVVIATQDVTEQRAMQRRLDSEQHRIELVVRAARVGIVDWDGHTHDTYYSPRFREIRGYPPDADTSDWPDYFKVMIHPDDREWVTKRWVTFIRGKGPEGPHGEYYSPEEYRMLRADGSYTWVQVSGMAVRDEKGLVLRWIAAIIDITQRREQDQALRASHDQIAAQAALLERQNETLKENVRLREEVERIGRHDIKTPLNSIVAVPRLLREERRLGPEADELLGIVERAGYRILSMVNLSLDLYKIEQGSYVFRPDAVDLEDLVKKVVADVRMHAASKQVKLQVELAPQLYAWAEELLCYSLLANLLKNAVEASPEGATVRVSTARMDDAMLVLRIHNEGVVPEAVRTNFFQKYATLGKASGTGLGTYSARLMARVQNGDIEMETSQAAGTTLSVRLNAAPPGAVPATVRHAAERRGLEPMAIAALPPMRVLLVDDDEYNLLIVRRFLPDPPFTVNTAINGRVALAAADLQWPDVVFMDLDMPVMGGLQAVQELRAMERASGAARCTMVALSSHEDDETRQRSLAAGFDRYLTKPVTREAIHETLLELALPAVVRPKATSAPPANERRAASIADAVVLDADVQAVLADFMVSRKALIAAMQQAMAQGDRAEVRRIAHQLTGSFGLYGFRWASEQSRHIENDFSKIEPADLSRLAGELREHLDSVEIRFEPL
jgi:PAS domain S-box-containing protein